MYTKTWCSSKICPSLVKEEEWPKMILKYSVHDKQIAQEYIYINSSVRYKRNPQKATIRHANEKEKKE